MVVPGGAPCSSPALTCVIHVHSATADQGAQAGHDEVPAAGLVPGGRRLGRRSRVATEAGRRQYSRGGTLGRAEARAKATAVR